MRNNDLLNKQLAGRLEPLINTHNANSILFAANQKRLADIIQRYNRECSGTVARAAYGRCKVQEGVLKEKSRAHNAERASLKRERAALTKERLSYVNRIKANAAKAKENLGKLTESGRKTTQHIRTLENHRTRLNDLCTKAEAKGDGDSLHFCHAVLWDGGVKSLPPLSEMLRGTVFLK